MELPKELQFSTYPTFEVSDKKIFIYNLPTTSDLYVVGITFLFFLYVVSGKGVPDAYNYPVLFFLIFLFFTFACLSLDKIVIDTNKKTITRKNYNPIMNFIRRIILQLPSVIDFKDVSQIDSDQTYFQKDGNSYYVYIITNTPYKLRIGTFSNKSCSEVFIEFLQKNVKLNQSK